MTEQPIFLVTGAAGFLGQHVVRYLHGEGVRIRAMVRKPQQAEALKPFAEEVVVADLQKAETLPKAVEGVGGIYHVGAIFRQEGVPDSTFHDINAEGTRRLLDAAIAAGVPRFIHCSTNGVHSDVDNPPANEEAPFKPGDVYQRSKLAGEQIALEYFREGRIAGVVLRPTMIYGPGDQRTLKLFRMIAKRRFFYIGPGNAYTHWVDARDVARAFKLAMDAQDLTAEAILIGGRRYSTLRENVHVIAKEIGVPEPRLHLPVKPVMALAHVSQAIFRPLGIEPPLFPRRVSFFLKHRAFDISKARELLGFEARQDFAGEVREIVAAYRESGDLPRAR